MALFKDLLDKPPTLSTASKYTATNGVVYLGAEALLLAWPGATQTLFMEPAFVGNEEGLIRMIGITVAVIGWLYLFGGRSGARQFVAGGRLRPLPSARRSADQQATVASSMSSRGPLGRGRSSR
jgi:hypothetical protein